MLVFPFLLVFMRWSSWHWRCGHEDELLCGIDHRGFTRQPHCGCGDLMARVVVLSKNWSRKKSARHFDVAKRAKAETAERAWLKKSKPRVKSK